MLGYCKPVGDQASEMASRRSGQLPDKGAVVSLVNLLCPGDVAATAKRILEFRESIVEMPENEDGICCSELMERWLVTVDYAFDLLKDEAEEHLDAAIKRLEYRACRFSNIGSTLPMDSWLASHEFPRAMLDSLDVAFNVLESTFAELVGCQISDRGTECQIRLSRVPKQTALAGLNNAVVAAVRAYMESIGFAGIRTLAKVLAPVAADTFLSYQHQNSASLASSATNPSLLVVLQPSQSVHLPDAVLQDDDHFQSALHQSSDDDQDEPLASQRHDHAPISPEKVQRSGSRVGGNLDEGAFVHPQSARSLQPKTTSPETPPPLPPARHNVSPSPATATTRVVPSPSLDSLSSFDRMPLPTYSPPLIPTLPHDQVDPHPDGSLPDVHVSSETEANPTPAYPGAPLTPDASESHETSSPTKPPLPPHHRRSGRISPVMTTTTGASPSAGQQQQSGHATLRSSPSMGVLSSHLSVGTTSSANVDSTSPNLILRRHLSDLDLDTQGRLDSPWLQTPTRRAIAVADDRNNAPPPPIPECAKGILNLELTARAAFVRMLEKELTEKFKTTLPQAKEEMKKAPWAVTLEVTALERRFTRGVIIELDLEDEFEDSASEFEGDDSASSDGSEVPTGPPQTTGAQSKSDD
eukprot:c20203_g1_i1.p1 GENE.c20203_g1_i1~~c20203_g1_i1.p1  ORF type:complete len:640 (+),score=109.18 c20203_g1_i1:953-2872(+)